MNKYDAMINEIMEEIKEHLKPTNICGIQPIDHEYVVWEKIALWFEKHTSKKDITCPFCGEDDFDTIGLKHHLNAYCDNYQKIQALR
ncbi:MAG TPA: hypothetical protein VMZ91_04600 [Candidatus Paceibacterota bacterium]|nr:hypothetical protein [Candidatus Paceibacterota bacterium]